jgi:hypothetical protein
MALTFSILVVAPVIYLLIAYVIGQNQEPMPSAGNDVMFYILLIIAVGSPTLIPLISRIQINSVKRQKQTSMTIPQIVQMVMIVRIAFVEATYIYGLVIFLLTGDWFRMLVFYAIGIGWSLVFWPTRSRQEALVRKIETNE